MTRLAKCLLTILLGIVFLLFSSLAFGQSPLQNTGLQIAFISDANHTDQVYTMDTNGNNIRQITNEAGDIDDATCSPDGQYIATTGYHGGIKLTQLANLSSTTLFGHNELYSNLQWSPDGSKLAFTSTLNSGGGFDIYTSNIDGSNLVRVTNTPGIMERTLTWSPSGNQLAFSSGDGTSRGIYVINADGSNRTRLTTNTRIDSFPSWSSDGSKIIFTSEQTNYMGLFTISPNGTNLTQLTGTPNIADWRPVWSPDVGFIAFDSSRDGNPEIYTMRSNGTNLQRLTNNTNNDWVVCWLTPTPQQNGTGLRGQYYDALNFATLKFFRINSPIDFNWGTGTPDAAIVADTFSVRWTGKVEPLYSEAYTFFVTHNDGARLWVNGQQIVNNWTNVTTAVTDSGTITLAAGLKYDIVLEYYENTGSASVKLEWQSNRQPRQVIPRSQLYPPEGQLACAERTLRGFPFDNMER